MGEVIGQRDCGHEQRFYRPREPCEVTESGVRDSDDTAEGAQLAAAEGSGFRRDGALPASAGHSPYSLDSFRGPGRADLYGFKPLLIHSYLSSVPVLHPQRVPSPKVHLP